MHILPTCQNTVATSVVLSHRTADLLSHLLVKNLSQFSIAGNIFDLSTCSCEEHCAWDLCRLVNPPNKCLRGTRSQWQWDSFKNAWVAQVIEGNKFYSKNTIRIKPKYLCLPNNVEKYLTFILRLTECYNYHNEAVRQT